MGSDGLIGIGAFAVLSGLSVNALRHYDEIGLLKPAHVDEDTGYRRYRPAQVRQARVIWALRHVDLPVESVREAVSAPQDGPAFRAILLRHRETLTARASAAGATERFAPYDKPWKPRTSHVTDPSGNWIDLTQA
jgi:DNA-binding transcriptional MerR regulator